MKHEIDQHDGGRRSVEIPGLRLSPVCQNWKHLPDAPSTGAADGVISPEILHEAVGSLATDAATASSGSGPGWPTDG